MVQEPRMSRYAGMTVNERLVEAGLIEDFARAAEARDRAAMISVLRLVDMGDLAEGTTDTVLRNPERYGY